MDYPRLLIFSNCSLSKSNSNGRTLGSLLKGWPKDRIAQFCINSEGADLDICDNYYCVTDGDVMRSALRLRPASRRGLEDSIAVNPNFEGGKRHISKTAVKMLARNIAWGLGIWRGKDFEEWTAKFSPEVVLLQNGESYFMHDLARKTARKFGAQLAIFNTEAPFLFEKDYLCSSKSPAERIFFPIYRRIYNRHFLRFMRDCQSAVYGNELLERDYRNAVRGHCRSGVILTASDVDFSPRDFHADDLRFSYLGSMGYQRPKALAEIGRTLQKISPRYHLDVYGDPQSDENERLLRESPGLRFHGSVSYEEVKNVIAGSDVLFHAEYDSEECRESLKYGFSTKIADSICSGKIFVMYAPSHIAGSQYVAETGAGVYCKDEAELEASLRRVITDEEYRGKIIANSLDIKNKNHSFALNTEKMLNALSPLPSANDQFRSYGGSLLYDGRPHIRVCFDRKALRKKLKEERAIFARYYTDSQLIDEFEECTQRKADTKAAPEVREWWHCVRTQPISMESLTAKQRYRIKKGLKLNSITLPSPEEAISLLPEITDVMADSFSDYPSIYKPSMENVKSGARRIVESCRNGDFQIFLVRDRQSGTCPGFGYCEIKEDMVILQMVKVRPSYLNNEVNAALGFEICKHYLNDKGMKYVCDGERNIRHITNYQEFLIRVLGFKKAYCRLHVEYHPLIGPIAGMLYPFRNMISRIEKANRHIYDLSCLLRQEAIARKFK